MHFFPQTKRTTVNFEDVGFKTCFEDVNFWLDVQNIYRISHHGDGVHLCGGRRKQAKCNFEDVIRTGSLSGQMKTND